MKCTLLPFAVGVCVFAVLLQNGPEFLEHVFMINLLLLYCVHQTSYVYLFHYLDVEIDTHDQSN